jgi:NAD(P)H-hydrate epimerase
MQPLSCQAAREFDRHATEVLGVPSIVLMENAGRACADVLLEEGDTQPVLVACGKGNNGGDGFVIARQLLTRGVEARVALFASPRSLQGDALVNYKILRAMNASITEVSEESDLRAVLDPLNRGVRTLVDALLGTGAVGAPRGAIAMAVNWLNAQRPPMRRVAVDLPSGLDGDTGVPHNPTVRADLTCTFVAPKIGFANSAAEAYLGEVRTLEIGVPSPAKT